MTWLGVLDRSTLGIFQHDHCDLHKTPAMAYNGGSSILERKRRCLLADSHHTTVSLTGIQWPD
jgi:hypothetical protein